MNRKYLVLFFLITAALLTRLPELSQRPLHVDEAVNAYILGEMIDSGIYVYSPGEYHGPTLYYFSELICLVAGISDFAGLNEFLIRFITVLAGIGIVLMVYLLGNMIHAGAGLPAAVLSIFSPMLIYFNRYYIHESLLVLLILIFIYLVLKRPLHRSYIFAVLSGITAGMIITTKETWMLYALALSAAYLLSRTNWKKKKQMDPIYWGVSLLITAAVIIAIFGMFFKDYGGADLFIDTLIGFFYRGTATPEHTHPWYYFLKILLYYRVEDIRFLSEIIPFLLAVIGIIFAFRLNKEINRFFAIYAIALLIVFSAIPYKTPWNILGLVPVLAVLGGSGIIYLREKVPNKRTKMLLVAIFLVMISAQGFESYRINYLYASHTANPFTYGHSRQDVQLIGQIMENELRTNEGLLQEKIAVIARNGDYWPLPWYLRRFKSVGWWDSVPQDIATSQVILVTPEMEADLVRQLYELTPFADRQLYLPLFDREMEIRPGVMIRGYIRYDLWQIVNTDSTGN